MTLYLDRHGNGSIYPPTKPGTPRGKMDGVRYVVEQRGKKFVVIERTLDKFLYIDGERVVGVCANENIAEQLARRLGGIEP